MPLSSEGAAKVWRALQQEFSKPGAEAQMKLVKAAMAADTSEDHIESKEHIAKVAWSIASGDEALMAECVGIEDEAAFVRALAENFLKEPALSARKELYSRLGLPPPDETGGSVTARMAAS